MIVWLILLTLGLIILYIRHFAFLKAYWETTEETVKALQRLLKILEEK